MNYTYISKSTIRKDAQGVRCNEGQRVRAGDVPDADKQDGGLPAARSVRLAKHAKRKTVEPSDVKIAFSNDI